MGFFIGSCGRLSDVVGSVGGVVLGDVCGVVGVVGPSVAPDGVNGL